MIYLNEMETLKMMENQHNLTDKEWLDLAWKYFQQHAQQRMQYFNYFVVFSTILTTGLVTTFQYNFQAPYLGIFLGLIQIFLSFIFWKIDRRNKFLIKHSENVIREIENEYDNPETKSYKLFCKEEIITGEIKKDSRHMLFKQFSYSTSSGIIYFVFSIIGIIGIACSSINYVKFTQNEVKSVSRKATIPPAK